MALPEVLCCQWSAENDTCQKTGKFACKNCFLVLYCSRACQRAHWNAHKVDCQSPLGKSDWEPTWCAENYPPAFVSDDGPPQVKFGGTKYLWGNVPAMDILQLSKNEGAKYEKDLNLLFAASGDMRNIFKTLAEVPVTYTRPINVTINDHDIDIVARNIIILLIASIEKDKNAAVECIIHFWYSASFRPQDQEILQEKVRPLIQELNDKIQHKDDGSLQAKTWTFETHSVRVVLDAESWRALLSYFEIPPGLTSTRAEKIRRDITLAPERVDYRDRNLLLQPTKRRITKTRFREDGLLLPFGSSRAGFTKTNPYVSFFQSKDVWPMMDNSDPLNGWLLKDVEATQYGPAKNDDYGKLFVLLYDTISKFLARIETSKVAFCIMKLDAAKLPNWLKAQRFDRIDSSNIADGGYLGLETTLRLGELLQPDKINSHATLLTSFMNAVEEVKHLGQMMGMLPFDRFSMGTAAKYLGLRAPPRGMMDPNTMKVMAAVDLVGKFDKEFNHYMKLNDFEEKARLTGMSMKNRNTIIEPWPFRLKLRPGLKGAKDEFERLLGDGINGKERYVEWRQDDVGILAQELEVAELD